MITIIISCLTTVTNLYLVFFYIEKWNFPNPCTKENLEKGVLKFPHPTDVTKYLMCDLSGKLYIVQCPQFESYYQSCQQCVGNTSSSCIVGKKNSTDSSPCTLANLQAGRFFFTYQADNTKFIHCDVWGKAWLMSCPGGEVWDQNILTCLTSGSGTQSGSTPFSPIVRPPSSTNYGGDEVNGFLCCPTCPRFSPPCTHDKISAGRLFHGIAGDRHHYIQCDLTGRMYCPMSCAPEADGSLDYFNYLSQTCVDGALSGIVG